MATRVSALEGHAKFFDPDGTGCITMGQTYAGMRKLGVVWVVRAALTPIINGFLGFLTQGHPSFVIRIDRIAQGKHPYDTGTFDNAGERDDSAFAALFAGGEPLTEKEMCAIVTARGNRKPAMGRVAAVLGHWFSAREIGVFFCVAADTTKSVNGRTVPAVSKKTLTAFYDGTLFHELARRRILVEAGCVRRRRSGLSAQ
jgi:hypothetical protein